IEKPGDYASPSVSPDGSRLAVQGSGGIWSYDLHRSALTRLTFDGQLGPVWSPDGHFGGHQPSIHSHIENLLAVAAPPRLHSSSSRYLEFAARPGAAGKWLHVDLISPRFVRAVRHPFWCLLPSPT